MHRFAFVLLLALAAAAEPAPIASIKVFDNHGDGFPDAERVSAWKDATGIWIESSVERNRAKAVTQKAALPKAEWDSLVLLVEGRALAEWSWKVQPAPDWGHEGFEVIAQTTTGASWTGPLDRISPIFALFNRMGDLAAKHLKKSGLIRFVGTTPATGRIRMAYTNPFLPDASNAGEPHREIEAEAREGAWSIAVRVRRSPEAPGDPATAPWTSEISKEEWEALVQLIKDSKLADWDSTDAAPDWGKETIDVDLGGKGILKTLKADPDAGSAPQLLKAALEALVKKKKEGK